MSSPWKEIHPELHIYAQPFQHAEAVIVGNRAALLALKEAIQTALESGSGHVNAFTVDGEGFVAGVIRLSGEEMEKMALPYTDEMYSKQSGVWPHTLPQMKEAFQSANEELQSPEYKDRMRYLNDIFSGKMGS